MPGFFAFMSFLDNLESTLKNLEGASDRDMRPQQQPSSDERARTLAAAPYAEELRKGAFANEFLTHAVKIGHSSRTKINMLWVGNTPSRGSSRAQTGTPSDGGGRTGRVP